MTSPGLYTVLRFIAYHSKTPKMVHFKAVSSVEAIKNNTNEPIRKSTLKVKPTSKWPHQWSCFTVFFDGEVSRCMSTSDQCSYCPLSQRRLVWQFHLQVDQTFNKHNCVLSNLSDVYPMLTSNIEYPVLLAFWNTRRCAVQTNELGNKFGTNH